MRVLIYAVGGGHGHTMRGCELAKRLRTEGCECRLVVREGSDVHLDPQVVRSYDSWSSIKTEEFDALVVDTFPRGWKSEISDMDIRRFPRSIFIARYNRLLDSSALDVFDEIWDPTPAGHSEWDSFVPAKPVGWLVDETKYTFDREPGTFWLIDSEDRLGSMGEKIVARAVGLGWEARKIEKLPRLLSADKFLFVGAGYNTFYETRAIHERSRFVPLTKRYDDQSRRAGSLALTDLREFDEWLGQSPESSGSGASSGKTS